MNKITMRIKAYKFMNRFFIRSFFSLLISIWILSCNSNLKLPQDFQAANLTLVNLPFANEANQAHFQDTLKPASTETLTLASWNIRDLGGTKTQEDIFQIANTLRDFDIVAVQEVVAKDPAGAQAVAKVADELNRMGSKWDYQISDPTRSPSAYMSERYAFLWKTSRVSIVHRAYLDKAMEDLCYREPFIAAFKMKGQTSPFYVLNYHSRKYYDKPEEEIVYFIDYPERLDSNRILIAGDFNLDENHEVWKPLYLKGFQSALKNKRTTLKIACKNEDYLNHPIDNIYFTPGITSMQSGSVDIVKTCGNLVRARKISDHLPVFITFKMAENNGL
jgi:endonuclease/exonuclease/phosphatase family metal-dependent hydrolase